MNSFDSSVATRANVSRISDRLPQRNTVVPHASSMSAFIPKFIPSKVQHPALQLLNDGNCYILKKNLLKLFTEADLDHNQLIDFEEFTAAIAKLIPEQIMEETKKLFQNISLEELVDKSFDRFLNKLGFIRPSSLTALSTSLPVNSLPLSPNNKSLDMLKITSIEDEYNANLTNNNTIISSFYYSSVKTQQFTRIPISKTLLRKTLTTDGMYDNNTEFNSDDEDARLSEIYDEHSLRRISIIYDENGQEIMKNECTIVDKLHAWIDTHGKPAMNEMHNKQEIKDIQNEMLDLLKNNKHLLYKNNNFMEQIMIYKREIEKQYKNFFDVQTKLQNSLETIAYQKMTIQALENELEFERTKVENDIVMENVSMEVMVENSFRQISCKKDLAPIYTINDVLLNHSLLATVSLVIEFSDEDEKENMQKLSYNPQLLSSSSIALCSLNSQLKFIDIGTKLNEQTYKYEEDKYRICNESEIAVCYELEQRMKGVIEKLKLHAMEQNKFDQYENDLKEKFDRKYELMIKDFEKREHQRRLSKNINIDTKVNKKKNEGIFAFFNRGYNY